MKGVNYLSININGLDWDICCVHSGDKKLNVDNVDCYGVTYFQEQQIYFNIDISKGLFRQTVIHEIVHAFLFSFGYHLDCDEIEEAVCDFIGSHLDNIYKTTNKIIAKCYKKDGDNGGKQQ